MPLNSEEHAYDGYLYSWQEIAEYFKDGGLLVGNGASQVVWPQFGYTSLYEEASSPALANPLTPADQALFMALGDTRNFEAVLRDLRIAAVVEDSLGRVTSDHLLERYETIKQALSS